MEKLYKFIYLYARMNNDNTFFSLGETMRFRMVRWLRYADRNRGNRLRRPVLLLDRETVFREAHRAMLPAHDEFLGALTEYQVKKRRQN